MNPGFHSYKRALRKLNFYEDVVLANNCLTEMSPRALAFYLKVLEKGSNSPIWICQGFGGRRILTKSLIWHAQEVILSFAVAGFYLSFFGPSSNSGDLPFAIFTKDLRKDLLFWPSKSPQPIAVHDSNTYVKCIQNFSFDSRFTSDFIDLKHTEEISSGFGIDQLLFMENIDEQFLKLSQPLATSKF